VPTFTVVAIGASLVVLAVVFTAAAFVRSKVALLRFEPFVGGGLITAMAVPFIHAFGDVAMLVVATIATIAVLGLGFRVTRA
jgi:hypothetical protein